MDRRAGLEPLELLAHPDDAPALRAFAEGMAEARLAALPVRSAAQFTAEREGRMMTDPALASVKNIVMPDPAAAPSLKDFAK